MNDSAKTYLIHLAGAFVLLSATIHLLLGIAGLIDPGSIGVETVVLPILFIVAAFGAYALVGMYRTEIIAPEMAYSVDAVMMSMYIIAYLDWHVLQMAETLLPMDAIGLEYGNSHGHDQGHDGQNGQSHSDSTFVVLVDHLRNDPAALITKIAELVAVGILAPLAGWSKSEAK